MMVSTNPRRRHTKEYSPTTSTWRSCALLSGGNVKGNASTISCQTGSGIFARIRSSDSRASWLYIR